MSTTNRRAWFVTHKHILLSIQTQSTHEDMSHRVTGVRPALIWHYLATEVRICMVTNMELYLFDRNFLDCLEFTDYCLKSRFPCAISISRTALMLSLFCLKHAKFLLIFKKFPKMAPQNLYPYSQLLSSDSSNIPSIFLLAFIVEKRKMMDCGGYFL